MVEPIPLNQAMRGKKRAGRPPNGPVDDSADGPRFDDPPVRVLGHLEGEFYFLDSVGQLRTLKAAQLSRRGDLVALFGGGAGVVWLERLFPRKIIRKTVTAAGEEFSETVSGFLISGVSDWLMAQAERAGLFGAHIKLRKPGIWPGVDGPVVHCGDTVIVGGASHPPGHHAHGDIFAAAAPKPRPGNIAPAKLALDIISDIHDLWNFTRVGAGIVLMGLVGVGYYGAAIPWRSNGFLIGDSGAGKSMLLGLLRACAPMHHYTDDTSKAGIEQAVNGNAMQIIVDEAADREDQRGAKALMDIVLSATGGEGTKGFRGSAGGVVRAVEVVGAIIMSSVAPPPMKPQHEARFTMIEVRPPEAGADHREEHKAAIERARAAGPHMWARAIAGIDRFTIALRSFRAALQLAGCAPREMDQAGAILAGWWVLTQDGVPTERDGRIGVAAISEFVRLAVDVAQDNSKRRMLDHLLSSEVALDRSSEKDTIGRLVERAFEPFPQENEGARKTLERIGMRCVRFDEKMDPQSRAIPRKSEGDGIWFANRARGLQGLFANSDFDGERWSYQLKRLETARKSDASVRIGGNSSRAIWVSRWEIVGEDNDPVTG